jgi:hypothetical protein
MTHFSATAIFCTDIREELLGSHTLVGVFPDNLSVPEFPGVLAISLYVRMAYSADLPLDQVEIYATGLEPNRTILTTIDSGIIEQSKRDAVERRSPVIGLVSKIRFNGVNFGGPTRLTVFVKAGSYEFPCGTLNVHQTAQTT